MAVLNLSVPAQHDYTDPTVELDPARLATWLSDLPVMNVRESVRLVSDALTALNEQQVDTEQRYRCLEAYRPVVQRLYETVDPQNIRQLSMSRRQRQEAIAYAEMLFAALAGGYKLVLLESRSLGAGFAGEALNRTVEALSYVLLDCFRYYRAVSPALVAELHQLYRFARTGGMQDVRLPPEAVLAGLSTAGLYKLVMLLSLMDPGRLAEGEAGLLADVLLEHVDQCRVIQGGAWAGNGAGLFLIDLSGDALPRACTALESPASDADPYLLDATDVMATLKKKIAGIPELIRQRSPEAIVLQHLAPEQDARQRREQRHRDGRWVAQVNGLDAIHAYLLQASGKSASADAGGAAAPVDCRVVDSSESGMKLFVEAAGAGDARVGDLLGIIEGEASHATVRLAMIRSLRVIPEGGMEAGVQIVAGGAGPVYCSLPDAQDANPVMALFLPAEEAAGITATLIASTGLYEEGRVMLIDVGGREIRVRAGRLVSDSTVFDRFEFTAE